MVSSSDFVSSGEDRLPGGEKEYEIFHIATLLPEILCPQSQCFFLR